MVGLGHANLRLVRRDLIFMRKEIINNKGFTIFELLVSTSIIIMLTALFLANYHGTGQKADLNTAAQALASDIRRAQSYALGLKEFEGSTPDGGWGVHFQEGNNFYIIFADDDSDGVYNDSGDYYSQTDFSDGIRIETLLGDGGGLPAGPNSQGHIVFIPPDPEISFCGGNHNCTASYSEDMEIILTNDIDYKTIYVNKFGLVDVLN